MNASTTPEGPGSVSGALVKLMGALGHQRFALYGTDTGMPIARV